MRQVNALEKEHQRRYAQLKQRAEESREKLETLLAAEGPVSPAADLFVQTNALREDLWTEELKYCRATGDLMSPDDARRYLAPLEKRFTERKPNVRGILNIPHN